MDIQYPVWIPKQFGSAQEAGEMNGLVEVLQNHAENISEQHKRIVATSGGIYPGKIIPTSNIPENLTQGAFIVSVPGTYSKFGNVTLPVADENNVYIGLIFWDGTTFSLETIAIPKQDMQPVNDAIKRMDDFIRDFAVTTDTEFNPTSKNPIANEAVTPMAVALESFIQTNETLIVDTNISNWVAKVYGKTTVLVDNDLYNKTLVIENSDGFKFLKYKGKKWHTPTSSEQVEYNTIVGIKNDNTYIVVLPSALLSTVPPTEEYDLDISNIKILYVLKKNNVSDIPIITLFKESVLEKDSVKKFIEKSVTPLNRMLDSFKYKSHEVPTNSVSTFGYIRNDGTVMTEDTHVKLLKDIDVNGYDKLYFKGYKAVVSTANVPNYCSIIGYKSDDSKIILLNAHNALLPQELLEREIDITDFVKISISYSNYGVALNFNPTIRLYGLNDEHENLDIVAKRTMSSFKSSLIPKVDLTKNYFHPAQDLTTNFEFSILSIGYFGNMNVFKLKGGSILFSGNFEMANNSSTYDATKYNTIYVYNEYDIAKVYIEN